MLAIVLLAFGIFCGFSLMLVTGVPVVVLRLFRLLPFDRRLWWMFAALVAFFVVRELVLRSYNYAPPTAAPEKFYFGIHLGGSIAGVIGGFLIGLGILFPVGKSNADQPVVKVVAIPATLVLVTAGIGMILACARPTAEKRAAYEQGRAQVADAVKRGDAEALRQLLADGANFSGAFSELDGIGALDYAVAQEDVEIVKCLLDPPRGRPARVTDRQLRPILQTGNRELIAAFLQGNQRPQRLGAGLRAAVANGDREMFDFLLQEGANPNACDGFDTPLISCAQHNRLEMAEELLGRGTNVNDLHGSPDLNRGCTALITAIDHGHHEMIQFLLENNADVNKTIGGKRSALQSACRICDVDTVALLIKHGAEVDYRSQGRNETALHWTLKKSQARNQIDEERKTKIVQMLIAAGADPKLKNKNGKTPSDLAGYAQLDQVIEILGQ